MLLSSQRLLDCSAIRLLRILRMAFGGVCLQDAQMSASAMNTLKTLVYLGKLTTIQAEIVDYATNMMDLETFFAKVRRHFDPGVQRVVQKLVRAEKMYAYVHHLTRQQGVVLGLLRHKYERNEFFTVLYDIWPALTQIVLNDLCCVESIDAKGKVVDLSRAELTNVGSDIIIGDLRPWHKPSAAPSTAGDENILSPRPFSYFINEFVRQTQLDGVLCGVFGYANKCTAQSPNHGLFRILSSPETIVYVDQSRQTYVVLYTTDAANVNVYPRGEFRQIRQPNVVVDEQRAAAYRRLCVLLYRANSNETERVELCENIVRSIWTTIVAENNRKKMSTVNGTTQIVAAANNRYLKIALVRDFFDLKIVPATLNAPKFRNSSFDTTNLMRFQTVEQQSAQRNELVDSYVRNVLSVLYERKNQWREQKITYELKTSNLSAPPSRSPALNVLPLLDAVAFSKANERNKCIVFVYTPVLAETNTSAYPNLALDFVTTDTLVVLYLNYTNNNTRSTVDAIDKKEWTLVVLANRTFDNVDHCSAERIIDSSLFEPQTRITNRFLTFDKIDNARANSFVDVVEYATTAAATTTIVNICAPYDIIFYDSANSVEKFARNSLVLRGVDENGFVLMCQTSFDNLPLLVIPQTRCLFKYDERSDATTAKNNIIHFNKPIECWQYVNYERELASIRASLITNEVNKKFNLFSLEKSFRVYNTYVMVIVCELLNIKLYCIANEWQRGGGAESASESSGDGDVEMRDAADELKDDEIVFFADDAQQHLRGQTKNTTQAPYLNLPLHVVAFMKKFSNRPRRSGPS